MVDDFSNLDSLGQLGRLGAQSGFCVSCGYVGAGRKLQDSFWMERTAALHSCWTKMQYSTTPSHTNAEYRR